MYLLFFIYKVINVILKIPKTHLNLVKIQTKITYFQLIINQL